MGEEGTSHHITDPGKEARSRAGIPIVPAFDSWRALAIAGVVLLHLLILSAVVGTGDTGPIARLTWGTVGHAIDVLFIVSGFVVFLPAAASGRFGNLGAYAIRRAARLLPAYWVILVIMFVIILLAGSVSAPAPGDFLAHLFGLQGPAGLVFTGTTNGFSVNPPVWTLSVEITFYVVLPMVAWIWLRKPWVGLLAAAVLTVAWNEAFQHIGEINDTLGLGLSSERMIEAAVSSTLQFPSWAFSFGLGMTGASVYLRVRDRRDATTLNLIKATRFVGIAGLVVFAWLTGNDSDNAPVELVAQYSRISPWLALGYSAFLAMVMVSFALGPGADRSLLANRRLRELGDISYGIFLSHMMIAFCLLEWAELPSDGNPSSFLIWTAAVVPASILYGYLSARFLEQPIRRWARRYGRTRTNQP